MHRQLGEAAEVLGNGRQCELELSAGWPTQPEAIKSQDALQVGEQHFDFLAIAARLLVVTLMKSFSPLDGAGRAIARSFK